MTRDRYHAIPIALIGLCTLTVVLVATLAVAVSLSDFDLRQSLPSLDGFGPAAIVVLRFLASLIGVVPTSPLLLAAGATEGVVLGTLYVLIGAQLGALAAFLIGRHFGRDFVARRGWLDQVRQTRIGRWLLDEKTSQSQPMLAVFLSRLIPGLNMDALSYLAGITTLSVWRSCLASFAALLPYTLLIVAAGQKLMAFGSDAVAIAVIALSALVGLSRKQSAPGKARARHVPTSDS
jgi:uncharacterized membrane protein YdjX (TVP38/TMEM64 family)